MKTEMSSKNIILLTIDCLRADHLHCMGYEKNISPNIDKLAKDGIIFTNMISNGPHTPYAVPALLASTLPPVKKRPRETIATVLKKYGYLTAAVNPNPVIFSTVAGAGSRVDTDFDYYQRWTR